MIFGRDSVAQANKLRPGKTIDLGLTAGHNDGPDVVIEGTVTKGSFGAAVAFVDANNDGLDDLIISAPTAPQSPSEIYERGQVYIILGNSDQESLGNGSTETIDDLVDVVIFGEKRASQLGNEFAGKEDFDKDNKNDVGIGAGSDVFLLFGEETWNDTIYLADIAEDHPETRVIKFVDQPTKTSSTTIRFLDLEDDADGLKDLLFGAYDADGSSGEIHAGRAYVTMGHYTWASEDLTTRPPRLTGEQRRNFGDFIHVEHSAGLKSPRYLVVGVFKHSVVVERIPAGGPPTILYEKVKHLCVLSYMAFCPLGQYWGWFALRPSTAFGSVLSRDAAKHPPRATRYGACPPPLPPLQHGRNWRPQPNFFAFKS